MALVISKVAQLKPHIELQQAINEFKQSLNPKQIQTLRRYEHATGQKPLTERDVFALTQELDRRYIRRGPSPSSCIGPRFHKFLQGIQHFASIGDVIIGGSQNLIASGVWTGIRFALLAIVDSSLFVDKISKIFMSIGKANSHLRDLISHFEGSSRLRSMICQYHVIIVKFCTVMVKHTEKSPLGRFVHSLNESVLSDFQTAMKEQEKIVQQEATLLTAREIRENGQTSSTLRSLVSAQTQRAQKQQTAATKRAILDYCSTYDYEQTWRTIRKAGAATVQRGDYLRWREGQISATLLVIGKLGYGKSVLLANIIDDLHLNTSPDACTIAYFFCRHDETQSLSPKTIIGCILRQLLQPLPDLDRLEPILHRGHSLGTLELVIKELPNLRPSASRIVIVIDGLDECSLQDRQEVLSALKSLQNRLKISLCSSVRLTSDAPPQAGYEHHQNLLRLQMSDNNPDLYTFIERELIGRLEARKIVLRDPRLILQIQKKLLTESQGMFLWVVLQIYYLCDMKTDDAIREALLTLPRTLSETFANILRRSAGDLRHEQQILLKIMLAAFQSLTTEQLLEVMSVCPGDSVWRPSRVLNSINPMLATCGPLMIVDEENDTVHLLHHSFRQFLERGAHGAFQPEFDSSTAESVMAGRVVTYMTYDIFDQKISTMVAPSVAGTQVSASVVKSLQPTLAGRVAIRLLRSKSQSDADVDIGHLLWQHRPQQDTMVEPHPFYDYCKLHWRQHVLRVSGSNASIYASLCTFLAGKANDLVLGYKDKDVLLLEALLGSHIAAADAIANAWKVDVDTDRMRTNLPLIGLVHSSLASEGIEPATGVLTDEILWVFGTRAASCGLTSIALSCLRQTFQRRNWVWDRILEVLAPPLECMLRAQHTEVYNALLLSALCRDRYLEMTQLVSLLEKHGFENPLGCLDHLILSTAKLDTAIYAGQRDLLARSLAESDELSSEVCMQLARQAFGDNHFDVFLIMYGCAVDWSFVAHLLTQGHLLKMPELHASACTNMSHKITFNSQPAQVEAGLRVTLSDMLKLGLFRDTQQVEGLHALLNELPQPDRGLFGVVGDFPLEMDSVRTILLLVLIRHELRTAAFCVQSYPEDFLSIQKIMNYLPQLQRYNSTDFLPLVDAVCAKALEWGFERATYPGEQQQQIAATDYWIDTIPKILASALRQHCISTAKACLRTVVALKHGEQTFLCTPECQALHGSGTLHMLEQLVDADLGKRQLLDFAPCASYILDQYSPEKLSQLEPLSEPANQQLTTSRDAIVVKREARKWHINKVRSQLDNARVENSRKQGSYWVRIPSEILKPLQEAIEQLERVELPEHGRAWKQT